MISLFIDLVERIQAKFELGIAAAIFTWPALSLAVENRWGGPDSESKREWLAGVISELFRDRLDTNVEDVETTLLQAMLDEFEVNVDDDSAYEVAQQIIQLRMTTLQGDFSKVDERYASWEAQKGSNALRFQRGADQGGEDSDSEMGSGGEDDHDGEMNDTPVQVPQRRPNHRPEADEEGFTKVAGKIRR